jgi:hypothetical protein
VPIPECKIPTGSCDIATGCTYTDVLNYPIVSCTDHNLCTFEDICIGGNCEGLPVMCDDICMTDGVCDLTTGACVYDGAVQCAPRVCQTGTCITAQGGCIYTDDNSLPCDDGIPCTTSKCVAGSCQSTAVICNQPCMNGVCDPLTGSCYFTPIPCAVQKCKTGVCDPATGGCTYTPIVCPVQPCMNGACDPVTGQCVYTPISCPEVSCMTGTCSPSTGECSYTPKNCSDNNPCTMDTCVSGNCVHTSKDCTRTGSNPCQFNNGTCNPSNGQCVYAVKSNGTTCDDGNLCTTKDTCTSGQCTGTNACCINRTKSKCGICVSDCCSDYGKVLSFFGLRGGESSVTEISGSCSGSKVCCAPVSQSIFTYQSDRCVVRKA